MRKLIALVLIVALAACQTVPKKLSFNPKQIAALIELGFKQAGENYELGLDDRVLFEVDQSELSSAAGDVLTRLGGTLVKVGINGASVVGHTDSTGSSEYNLALSQRRAAAVKGGLVTAGMNAARIRDSGVGETQPVASNDTPEGRQQNRRVVIIVAPSDAN
jgi:outer membrane protein OmpA-like peptidoglycan-associated protein